MSRRLGYGQLVDNPPHTGLAANVYSTPEQEAGAVAYIRRRRVADADVILAALGLTEVEA